MHLALAPQHDLAGLGVVDDDERWVFFHQLVQRLAELDVVLALARRDREPEHRRQRRALRERRNRLLAGRDRVERRDRIELAERDRLAGLARAALFRRPARLLEDAGDARRLAARG